MSTSIIVEDPEEGFVTFQDVVCVNHTIGVMPIITIIVHILRSSGKGMVSGAGNIVLRPRTEVIVNVIIRIVTIFRIIDTVVIDILKRSKVVGITFVTMCRPVGNACGHHITGGVIGIDMLVNLGTGDFEVFIEFDTHGLCRAGTGDLQRTGPVVVTDLSETHGGQFQLTVGVFTTNPQCGAEHGRFTRASRYFIFGNLLEPHCTTSFDVGAYIVHRQLIGATCRKTGSRLRFR